MTRRISRRNWLKSTAAAGAAFTVLPAGLARGYAANEKVNVGIIGVAGMGGGNRKMLKAAGANIVALCDADRISLEGSTKDHPGAKTWADFRKMLLGQKEIDAVMVSTPDHTHAPASMMAIKLGVHVCTEKPLTHSVYEARALGEAAKQYKVATQMDNEGHAGDGIRKVVEWVQSGAIGKIREAHVWTDRPAGWWKQGLAQRPASKPAPARLDWDLWLGPAPYREYHDGLHPFHWRGYWDFGTGALGDMGCHMFDAPFWALKLRHPTTVEAIEEGNSRETGPVWSIVTYEFPARGDDFPPVTLKWYDGKKLPPVPEELGPGGKLPSNGSLLVGDKGKILVEGTGGGRIIPEEKMRAYEQPEPFVPRSPGHKQEWLRACQGGEPASSNFTDYGGPLAEVVLLGNLALRAGKKIQWDGENLKAKNAPEVDQFIRREYRKGWEL